MGRRSTIELHPERARIERDIALRVPIRKIAKKYKVSPDAVGWHKRHNMPSHLKAELLGQVLKQGVDLEQLRLEESEGLLANLAAQRVRLLAAQDAAIERRELAAVAHLGSQIHRNLQLVGQYLGEFAQHQIKTNINILVTPEYLELRAALVRALMPYGEARRAVVGVIQEIEGRLVPGAQANHA
jgi:hypothetical protein